MKDKTNLIINSLEELIVYLKAVTISHSPDNEYEEKLISEIASLQGEQERTKRGLPYNYERMFNIIKSLSAEDTNRLVDFLLSLEQEREKISAKVKNIFRQLD